MATMQFSRYTNTVASGQLRPDVLTARPLTRTVITLKAKARLYVTELGHLETSLIHFCHLYANVGNFSATRARRGGFRVKVRTATFTRQFRDVEPSWKSQVFTSTFERWHVGQNVQTSQSDEQPNSAFTGVEYIK